VEAGGKKVRSGLLVLGDALTESMPVAQRELMLRALAMAHVRTTAPLLCPLPVGVAPARVQEALSLLTSLSVPPSSVLIGHAQHLLSDHMDLEPLRILLRQGVCLVFDGLGNTWSHVNAGPQDDEWSSPPSDKAVARAVVALVTDGFAVQLLLSHCVSSQLQLLEMGGGGFCHISRSFLPRLRHHGLTPEHEQQLTRTNAARLFRWSRPAGPAARLMKQWSCSACHRVFEEAVNPADVLPTDREYYEKFSFRYCATSCLSAHRKANFVQPFSVPPPAK